MSKPIYVLGTGLSHNGSAVLLKDGKVEVAIEKERLSRVKHDGNNDTLAIQYCLEAAGIELTDLEVVVQTANFDIPAPSHFFGDRLFKGKASPKVIDISHHLAHAYSAIGTAPFDECAVMVIDGCGSPLDQFLQLNPTQAHLVQPFLNYVGMQCEKDSFYHFDGHQLKPLIKDFSRMWLPEDMGSNLRIPNTRHSIGGFYAAISHYIFGDLDDVGKLMGLAPFGSSEDFDFHAFVFDDDQLFLNLDWCAFFDRPANGYTDLMDNFSYYANIAKWAQEQVEYGVLECIKRRLKKYPHDNLCFSGGVALNAVANAKLEDAKLATQIYFEPAAADNGLALGCAFYGWMTYLNQPKVAHDGSTCFGKSYTEEQIQTAIDNVSNPIFRVQKIQEESTLLSECAQLLAAGKVLAWFQAGSEFGPRALGRRSILAHPGLDGLKDHINRNIKFREDFRPFAPAVLEEKVGHYFSPGRYSPYMILVDQTKPEYLDMLKNVVHCNGSARVQTVGTIWNGRFRDLLQAFDTISGIPILLNTSFNKKGMPIVETPKEAIALFQETALDALAIGNYLLLKN